MSLIAKWEKVIGVKAERLYIRRMKTKWGSCNHQAKTIRLNTDLANKPRECLEYVVVHELVHRLEQYLPKWRLQRQTLNQLPVRHERWAVG